MLFSSKTAFLACVLPQALAQWGGGAVPPVAPSAAAAAVAVASATGSSTAIQTVTVGANGALAFSPNNIVAAVGSSVEFIFSPPMHSVAQSSFAAPCVNNGFFSGLFTTSSGTNTNSFIITINDTNPIWFFCGFPGHCELGMAGVINAPSDGSSTLAAYQSAAASVMNAPEPEGVKGGIVGPVKAANSAPPASAPSASAPSATSSSAAATSSTTTTSAAARGLESGGSTQWLIMALTGLLAVGFGSLIM